MDLDFLLFCIVTNIFYLSDYFIGGGVMVQH